MRGVSPLAALLRAWASVLLAPTALWAPLLAASCAQERRTLRQHAVTLLVPDGHLASGTGGAVSADAHLVSAASPAVAWARRAASWPRAGPVDGLTILLPLPLPEEEAEAGRRARSRGRSYPANDAPIPPTTSAGAGAPPSLGVELLLPGWPWETGAPAVCVHTAAGDALVLDGRTRWRLSDAGQCCVVVYEYRPQPAGIGALPARAVEAAAVTCRAALALVVGPTPSAAASATPSVSP